MPQFHVSDKVLEDAVGAEEDECFIHLRCFPLEGQEHADALGIAGANIDHIENDPAAGRIFYMQRNTILNVAYIPDKQPVSKRHDYLIIHHTLPYQGRPSMAGCMIVRTGFNGTLMYSSLTSYFFPVVPAV